MARLILALLMGAATATKPCTPPAGTEGADDGNPHCWDRKRRCDGPNAHATGAPGYAPACGLCEGLGGEAWGDKNEQFKVPECTPIALAKDVHPTPPVPEWAWGNGGKFTAESDRFTMIGKKQDPFCFNFVPSNNSTGSQCYRRQTGKLFVDMSKEQKSLRYDLNIHIPWPSDKFSLFGNMTTSILHNGPNMWIVSNLKVMNQCVCTKVCSTNPCPPPPFPSQYPVMYNWTKNLNYMGREKITVEYGIGPLVLDHWNYGPHHAWTQAGDNKIVRMWQPYNGFEVFKPGTWKDGVVDDKVFEHPPALCKKGGAFFRIGCGDDGMPKDSEEESATVTDLRRARTKVPRNTHKGDDFNSTSQKLNTFLRAYENVKECRLWTASQLQEFQARIFMLRAPELDNVYATTDDRRRLVGDLPPHFERWEKLLAAGRALGETWGMMHRDGHCHEAVMWFVHHLTEPMRRRIAEAMPVPLLPYTGHSRTCSTNHNGDKKQLCDEYLHQVTCADCHSDGTASPLPPASVVV
jgi:hypothetical protein